mmetsp:Transcript_103086/g.332182  ORF Transcript_103086/g.332182 Transcript_103086/m.332182 type:complete len:82 (-) Transcript_103086:60-305(-)
MHCPVCGPHMSRCMFGVGPKKWAGGMPWPVSKIDHAMHTLTTPPADAIQPSCCRAIFKDLEAFEGPVQTQLVNISSAAVRR